MAPNPEPVPNAGCFLCGRPGTVRVNRFTPENSISCVAVFRYHCPSCGEYDIPSVLCLESVDGSRTVEIEAAALEHWNSALEVAERQRRLSKKSDERDVRRDDSNASACA